MKKCTYCGKEYPDDAVRCLIDDEPLSGGETASSVLQEKNPLFLTEKRMRLFEVGLLCTIAFGTSFYISIYSLFDGSFESTASPPYYWGAQILRESVCLALLWYVLTRRGKSFIDLGFGWSWKDFGWSIVLFIAGFETYRLIYLAIQNTGLTTVTLHETSNSVGYLLFGRGIFLSTFIFQMVNPFCEELIARAYLMTEVKNLTKSIVWAVAISTIFQASYHLYQGVPAAVSHVGEFLIFSIFYAKTNRITPVILAHLYTDVSATLFYWWQHH
jgi:membrane protease YdiL (CAAX protease family)